MKKMKYANLPCSENLPFLEQVRVDGGSQNKQTNTKAPKKHQFQNLVKEVKWNLKYDWLININNRNKAEPKG